MSGKVHKMIGVAVGVAVTLYGIGNGRPIFALGIIGAPFGAMLPDIDHDRSRIGSMRKKLLTGTKWWIFAVSVLLLILFAVTETWEKIWSDSLLQVLIAALLLFMALIIANTPGIKKKMKFFTKHRGIMHTLIVPVLLVWLGIILKSEIAYVLLLSCALGYLSHLLSDCLTVKGCPLVWPLTKRSIHLIHIREKTVSEFVASILLSGGIIWMGAWLGRIW